MSIEHIQTRPIPVAEVDAVDVARKIAQGLVPSAVINRTTLTRGAHTLSDTPTTRQEVEVLDDGSGVYRFMPSRQRLRTLGLLKAGRGKGYHLPHDRSLIVLRGPGSGFQGNIVGVLVHREDTKR